MGRPWKAWAPEKACTKCKVVKPLEDFARHNKTYDGRSQACRACLNAATRLRPKKPPTPEQRRRYKATDRMRTKAAVFAAYGGFCVCCGISDLSLLTIDHIDGMAKLDGNHRAGSMLYRKLRREGFPKDNYQLLCMSCNWSKGHGPARQCVHVHQARELFYGDDTDQAFQLFVVEAKARIHKLKENAA